ncbi:unnamed protein product [Phytomonas sp. Hart1]|nr:unnamed protein product [Phytomonas sp. Hart1]|eukprot:CCW71038.1 unnamed protein product [Phytomonas sp. isolate Hart1]
MGGYGGDADIIIFCEGATPRDARDAAILGGRVHVVSLFQEDQIITTAHHGFILAKQDVFIGVNRDLGVLRQTVQRTRQYVIQKRH